MHNFKKKLTGLKIADPILFSLVVLALVIAFFFFFPKQKKDGNTEDAFLEKVEQKIENDEARANAVQERFSEKMNRRAEAFQETQEVQEERKKRAFAESRYRELQERMETQRERFPAERFLEEIQVTSYFAPISTETGQKVNTSTDLVKQSVEAVPHEVVAAPNEPVKRVEVRAGTWIPIVLNHEMRAMAGFGRGTVREDVFDVTGDQVAIPKGSVVTLEMLKNTDYFVSALVAKQITLPNGTTMDIPFAGHGRRGSVGLDARESGKMKRHLLQKIGLTSLIAAISASPKLLDSGEQVSDLAQMAFVDQTSRDLSGVLKDALSLPNEKILFAGARVQLLVVDSILMPPFRPTFSQPSSQGMEAELRALKERMFHYQQALDPKNIQTELRRELQRSTFEGGN